MSLRAVFGSIEEESMYQKELAAAKKGGFFAKGKTYQLNLSFPLQKVGGLWDSGEKTWWFKDKAGYEGAKAWAAKEGFKGIEWGEGAKDVEEPSKASFDMPDIFKGGVAPPGSGVKGIATTEKVNKFLEDAKAKEMSDEEADEAGVGGGALGIDALDGYAAIIYGKSMVIGKTSDDDDTMYMVTAGGGSVQTFKLTASQSDLDSFVKHLQLTGNTVVETKSLKTQVTDQIKSSGLSTSFKSVEPSEVHKPSNGWSVQAKSANFAISAKVGNNYTHVYLADESGIKHGKLNKQSGIDFLLGLTKEGSPLAGANGSKAFQDQWKPKPSASGYASVSVPVTSKNPSGKVDIPNDPDYVPSVEPEPVFQSMKFGAFKTMKTSATAAKNAKEGWPAFFASGGYTMEDGKGAAPQDMKDFLNSCQFVWKQVLGEPFPGEKYVAKLKKGEASDIIAVLGLGA